MNWTIFLRKFFCFVLQTKILNNINHAVSEAWYLALVHIRYKKAMAFLYLLSVKSQTEIIFKAQKRKPTTRRSNIFKTEMLSTELFLVPASALQQV